MKTRIAAAALYLAAIPGAAADSRATPNLLRLSQAAYFSPTCAVLAEAISVSAAPDAAALITAFFARIDLVRGSQCVPSAVLLINALRRHGFDAELAFIAVAGRADRIQRITVYVPLLDRYFDPEHGLADQQALEDETRKRKRFHLAGPTLGAPKPWRCSSTCLWEHGPDRPDIRRVKAIVISTSDPR